MPGPHAPRPCGAPPPTLAIVNARVWTGDARRPWADAVAIAGDRVSAVGSSAEVRKAASASTRIVDARGMTLLPGATLADALARYAGGASRAGGAAIQRDAPADFVLVAIDVARMGAAGVQDADVALIVARGAVTLDRLGPRS
ncbi:MAG TPA: hypothetical protein VG818_09110 [Gemmatimonadaceae bacterium]|nr:hypothetical protein [Gemmatimonadaceae bacterium]